MSFGDLQELQRQLRSRICAHVDPSAMQEINVAIPSGDADELSFLRLVVWCYALVQETCRVPLQFLQELPPATRDPLPEVSQLRTWLTHNLRLDKTSDQKKLKLAWTWLARACGASSPTTPVQWKACFVALCERVGAVLKLALTAAEALNSPEDGERLVGELRKRLDRNWEAYQFDEPAEKVAQSLGFSGLDLVTLRKRKLDAWRKVVEMAEHDQIERQLAQRIQIDLLELMNGSLSVSASEVLDRFHLETPGQGGAFLLALRRAQERNASLTALELLEKIAQEAPAPPGPGS